MLQQLQAAGLGTASDLLSAYDARTDAAVSVFLESLPGNARGEALLEIADGYEAARKSWEAMQSSDGRIGADVTFEDGPGGAPSSLRQLGSASSGLVQDAGAEDAEHPFADNFRTPRVQRALARIVDQVATQGVRDHYEQLEETFDMARLDDLRHPETDHSWMWSLSSQQGIILEDRDEFVEAVRVRLGAGGPPVSTLCTSCGQRTLDRAGAHASCCAPGESTRGHNAVRDVLFEFALHADPSAEKEPEFLIPSRPRDRPADVLTSAVPGCVAALDVGVASPAAAAAGDDAAKSMRIRKIGEREPVQQELEQAGIVYKPFVFTTFGRPDAAACDILKSIVKRGARRKGWYAVAFDRKFRASLVTVLARRMARMSLSTWVQTQDDVVITIPDSFGDDIG